MRTTQLCRAVWLLKPCVSLSTDGISVDEYFYPDMGADEAAKKRINIQLNSLNESELRLVEGIINAIIENRGAEGA